MEFDFVRAQHLGTQFRHHYAIDADHAGFNVFVGIASGADTGIGQELVEAEGYCGVIVFLLVFHAFLVRILGVRIISRAALLRPSVAALSLVTRTEASLSATGLVAPTLPARLVAVLSAARLVTAVLFVSLPVVTGLIAALSAA